VSGNVPGHRYDVHGRAVEEVMLEIDRYGGTINIYIRGEKMDKFYAVSAEGFRAALDRTDEQFRERGGTGEKI
jgi:hypothetical protein